MQQVYNISWEHPKATAVAMGYFDGIHIGHQSLIDCMKQYAQKHNLEKGIFTFTKSVVLGHKGKDLIQLAEKQDLMEKMAIDLYYSPDFSVFSQLTPQEFVDEILVKSMKAKAVFCGENFCFGKNRSGNVSVLKELCAPLGIEVFVAPTVYLQGETVSSSAIRTALAQGDIAKVNAMLGRPYSICFEVVHGKNLGTTLGTPTINQIYPEFMCTPKEGVYITKTTLPCGSYPSATGFGSRPTVNGTNLSCETFISGFCGDLYHQKVQVSFFDYLYPTRKFDHVNQLKEMIEQSVCAAQDYFEKHCQ